MDLATIVVAVVVEWFGCDCRTTKSAAYKSDRSSTIGDTTTGNWCKHSGRSYWKVLSPLVVVVAGNRRNKPPRYLLIEFLAGVSHTWDLRAVPNTRGPRYRVAALPFQQPLWFGIGTPQQRCGVVMSMAPIEMGASASTHLKAIPLLELWWALLPLRTSYSLV